MKQHNAVPWNQVAVDIFVWEVNCGCDIIQELKETWRSAVWKKVTFSQISTAIILYLCFDSILVYQALPDPMEFSY